MQDITYYVSHSAQCGRFSGFKFSHLMAGTGAEASNVTVKQDDTCSIHPGSIGLRCSLPEIFAEKDAFIRPHDPCVSSPISPLLKTSSEYDHSHEDSSAQRRDSAHNVSFDSSMYDNNIDVACDCHLQKQAAPCLVDGGSSFSRMHLSQHPSISGIKLPRDLKLQDIIGKGSYGTVYEGALTHHCYTHSLIWCKLHILGSLLRLAT